MIRTVILLRSGQRWDQEVRLLWRGFCRFFYNGPVAEATKRGITALYYHCCKRFGKCTRGSTLVGSYIYTVQLPRPVPAKNACMAFFDACVESEDVYTVLCIVQLQ